MAEAERVYNKIPLIRRWLMDLPPRGYKRNLVISAYIILICLILWVLVKHLLSPILPFVIAYVTATFLRPCIDKICKRTGMNRKAAAFLTVGFVFALVFSVTGIFFGRLISELEGISKDITGGGADFIEGLFSDARSITDKLPIIKDIDDKEMAQRLKNALSSMLEGALSSFASRIPDFIMGIFSSLPGIILFTITLICATFYLGADISSLNVMIMKAVPREHRGKIISAKERLMSAGAKYIKAYAIILFITFIQLLIGFFILKIPYALTLSAVIALIDILPVLGVGTVLVPWAAVLLLTGDSYTGVGLLIVFGVIWLVRQVSEPKIVGQSLGIHPLLTLAAMYIGFKLVGFGGLFLFPIGAMIGKCVYDSLKGGER